MEYLNYYGVITRIHLISINYVFSGTKRKFILRLTSFLKQREFREQKYKETGYFSWTPLSVIFYHVIYVYFWISVLGYKVCCFLLAFQNISKTNSYVVLTTYSPRAKWIVFWGWSMKWTCKVLSAFQGSFSKGSGCLGSVYKGS